MNNSMPINFITQMEELFERHNLPKCLQEMDNLNRSKSQQAYIC